MVPTVVHGPRAARLAAAIAVLIGSACAGACSGTSAGSSTGGSAEDGASGPDAGATTPDVDERRGVDEDTIFLGVDAEAGADGESGPDADQAVVPDGPQPCEPMAQGVLRTESHLVPFDSMPAVVTAQHLEPTGCVAGLEISLPFPQGDCELRLTLQSVGGDWFGSGGVFEVAADCAWPPQWSGNWTLDPANSAISLITEPALAADDAFEAAACVAGADVELVGRARFVNGPSELVLRLDGIELAGGLPSAVATTVAGPCPTPATLCEGLACDEDGWGVVCGVCGDEEQCVEGGCVDAPCPPKPPFGTGLGAIAADASLRDCDGEPVTLHDLCGAAGSYLYLLTPFSPTSSQFVSKVDEAYEPFEAQGLVGWVVLTADLTGGPPDAAFCAQYADLKGFTMKTVYDADGAMAAYGGDGTALLLNERAQIVWKASGASVPETADALEAELEAVLGECSHPAACGE